MGLSSIACNRNITHERIYQLAFLSLKYRDSAGLFRQSIRLAIELLGNADALMMTNFKIVFLGFLYPSGFLKFKIQVKDLSIGAEISYGRDNDGFVSRF